MPEIKLADNSSLEITSESASTPALDRYLEVGLVFIFSNLNSEFKQGQAKPISQIDATSFPLALSANAPGGSFALSDAILNVQGGGAASLDLMTGDKKKDFLQALHLDDAPDLMSFAFTASLEGGPSGSVGDFSFGLTSGQQITVTAYSRVAATDRLSDAVKKTISCLTLPHDLDDLQSMPEGDFCRLEGKGSLKFTACVQYSFLNSALANEPLDFVSASLSVKAQSGPKLQVTVEHSDTHQLTIASLGGNKVRLGASLTAESDIQGSFDFSIGVSANIGSEDALAFLLQHISPSPDKDLQQISDALPADARSDLSGQIKNVLQGAMTGGTAASLQDALERSRRRNHLFVYDVDLAALDAVSKPAVQAALRGDFTEITANGANLAGIIEVDSLSTLTLTTTHTLTLHLIGILNCSDVTTFVQKLKPALNAETGDVVLTSSEIQITENNIDSDHLREVLLRSAMITTAAASSPKSPNFVFKMIFFCANARPSASELQQFFNVLQAISSPDADKAKELMNRTSTPVREAGIYLSLNLNKELSLVVFRNRNSDDYVIAGQNALRTILAEDKASANRLRLCSLSIDFWKKLREKGNRQDTLELLASQGITDQASVVDFFAIDWWAQAMGKVASALAKQQSLKDAEQDALKKSEGGFNIPWALLAVRQLAGSPEVDSKFTVPAAAAVRTVSAVGR